MMGPYDPRYTHTIDTLNRLGGLSKDNVKWWLATQKIKPKGNNGKGNSKKKAKPETVSDEFADKVASLAIASPYEISKAILKEFYDVCMSGINPEKSPTFRRKMITGALPAHIYALNEKASDLSLRASTVKHMRESTKEPEYGF